MAMTDAILRRLLELHPKIIDLTLGRVERLLEKLGHPERHLPPVIHVAGTNGKGSTVAMTRAILEAAGLRAHAYTSPHLVRFHERIRLDGPGASAFISDAALSALLEECEQVNGGEPITFFEITTVAAFLAFARTPADYLLLEVGLGGRLDATNVIAPPRVTAITSIDYDHQQYLGTTLTEIATEKAGILKAGVPAIIGRQSHAEVDATLHACAARLRAPLFVCGEDWQVFEQEGRLVFQDEDGLLDLPLPALGGRHQIDNAGNAIALVRALKEPRVNDEAFAQGLKNVTWPARMQRLGAGPLLATLPDDAELWLDGGHNPAGARAVAQGFADLNERVPKPLVLIWGMLNTKEITGFISAFAGLAARVIALAIPGEPNAVSAQDLMQGARAAGFRAESACSLQEALEMAGQEGTSVRVLICGSLYLAGQVLALQAGSAGPDLNGTSRSG